MLTRPKPVAQEPPGASATPSGPSYSPGFLKRQAVVSRVPDVAPGTMIGYDRGILAEPIPVRPMPLQNSEFSRLERGPIRNFYVRDWYWRGMWGIMRDDVMPNAHVPIVFLPQTDGRIEGLPGGTAMVPQSRLTFTLSTPAWQINPDQQQAVTTGA